MYDWISVKERMPEDLALVDIWGFYSHGTYPMPLKDGHRIIDCVVSTGNDGEGSPDYKIFTGVSSSGRTVEFVAENFSVSHWRPATLPPTPNFDDLVQELDWHFNKRTLDAKWKTK
jgi:hypothetical protein